MINSRSLFETGQECEFLVNGIGRHESAGTGVVRVYLASRRGENARVEASIVGTPGDLADLGRELISIAMAQGDPQIAALMAYEDREGNRPN